MPGRPAGGTADRGPPRARRRSSVRRSRPGSGPGHPRTRSTAQPPPREDARDAGPGRPGPARTLPSTLTPPMVGARPRSALRWVPPAPRPWRALTAPLALRKLQGPGLPGGPGRPSAGAGHWIWGFRLVWLRPEGRRGSPAPEPGLGRIPGACECRSAAAPPRPRCHLSSAPRSTPTQPAP